MSVPIISLDAIKDRGIVSVLRIPDDWVEQIADKERLYAAFLKVALYDGGL
ncbi:MAG: hypothetical protein LBV12_05660 [Puniceicoccales bacterium]|jgi:hypothetical protein|nr:hypothetical protein [Puniceicoccales bacterium]